MPSARGLPVVALKSGRTPAGQRAAQSHTGALANEDRVVEAFLAQHGIWRAQDVNELVGGVELYLKGWKPKGRRLVAISNSGATCVMAADAATVAGLPMAQLGDDTRAALGKILPSFATTTNPVDITAALLSNSGLFGQILPVIARDASADAFLIGIPVAGQGYDVDSFAGDTAVFARRTGKPVVVAIPQANIAAKFKAQGVPVFTTESEAVSALAHYLSHMELMQRLATEPVPPPARRVRRRARRAPSTKRTAWSWCAVTGCRWSSTSYAARARRPRRRWRACAARLRSRGAHATSRTSPNGGW